MRKNRLDLGCENQKPVNDGIEQRTDAKLISGQEKCSLITVVDRKTKLRIQLVEKLHAFVFIQVDQHFNVGLAPKCMALLFQPASQFAKVENLTVATQHQRPIFVEYGLIACCEIDDAQPPRSESGVFIHKIPVRIRASMDEGVRHASNDSLFDASGSAQIKVT